MASELTQVLPIALGQLVNNNQGAATEAKSLAQYSTPRDISYITQVAAAQTASKVDKNDKERAPQVPKRSEPNFSSQDEKPENEPSSLLSKGSKKKHDGKIDLVA